MARDRAGISPPGRSHRAHRFGKLREPARAARARLGAHQQIRRRLSRQALLRRLRVRRHRRAACDRPREDALRRGLRERAAALGRAGEPGGLLRDAASRRYAARHGPGRRRPSHARRADEHQRPLLRRRQLRPGPGDRGDRLRRSRGARPRQEAEADHRRRVRLFARHRLEALSRDRRQGRRAVHGGHRALRGSHRCRLVSRARSASPIS